MKSQIKNNLEIINIAYELFGCRQGPETFNDMVYVSDISIWHHFTNALYHLGPFLRSNNGGRRGKGGIDDSANEVSPVAGFYVTFVGHNEQRVHMYHYHQVFAVEPTQNHLYLAEVRRTFCSARGSSYAVARKLQKGKCIVIIK